MDSTGSDNSTLDHENQHQTNCVVQGFIRETSRIRQRRRENFDDGNNEAEVSEVTAVVSADAQQLGLPREAQE